MVVKVVPPDKVSLIIHITARYGYKTNFGVKETRPTYNRENRVRYPKNKWVG